MSYSIDPQPNDRWYVEIDEQPVAIIENPVQSDMFWFTWDLQPLDDKVPPADLWDYTMDERRSFRHLTTNERCRSAFPAGNAVMSDGRVLLRGLVKGRP